MCCCHQADIWMRSHRIPRIDISRLMKLIVKSSFTSLMQGYILSSWWCVKLLQSNILQCVQKNLTLWNSNYLQAIVSVWRLWMLRMNDPQKHEVLYTHGNYMTLILLSNVYKAFFLRSKIFRSSQVLSNYYNTLKLFEFERVKLFWYTLYRVNKKHWCLLYSN